MTIDTWADFNTDRTHRYSLGRRWSAANPSSTRFDAEHGKPLHRTRAPLASDSERYLVVIGLNPSIADADRLDPTVTRCVERARRLGYGGLVMLNLFSLVSTDPRGLEPVTPAVHGDPGNWRAIEAWCTSPLAGMVLAAWGAHAVAQPRARAIAGILTSRGVQLHALGVTKAGAPRHPLYVPYTAQPAPWRPPALA